MENAATKIIKMQKSIGADKKLRELAADELVFAVVGPVGSGTSAVAQALVGVLSNTVYSTEPYVIKASEAIQEWVNSSQLTTIDGSSTFKKVTSLQDAGDMMRAGDEAAVAMELIAAIQKKRAALAEIAGTITSIKPSEVAKRRVYILDSLKHPSEVALLRAIYQDSFCLIGVVCEESTRGNRLFQKKCTNTGNEDIQKLMKRDEDADISHGQKVTDTFHLADYFVDNSPERFEDEKKKSPNPRWDIPGQLGRLVDLLTYGKIIRPTASETGMFHAYGAKMRSACLSRQVGAALLDVKGNILSTGTNEVPQAGGGVYGGSFADFDGSDEAHDDRCAVGNGYCSSNRNQAAIIEQIIDAIPQLKLVENRSDLAKQLKKTPIGKILEFSRAVHAEMDALLSAARTGASTVGTRLFVTTYPCHYCARHIVSAGVDEVQYIEPYPKSQALSLHGDAITGSVENWIPPSFNARNNESSKKTKPKVLFRPFTGVAPRLYRQAFLKNRKLKNDFGDMEIYPADSASGLLKLSYRDVENALLNREE